jgi:multisubunit Na+/H+ antiporter MnhE subunit
MGSPISSIIAEIFLQFHENTHLNHLLEQKSIVFLIRYVDDIFILYDTDRTTHEKIQDYMNKLHPNLEFTPTLEDNNRISFLDLLITRQPSTIEIDICRKPTTTDTTINFTSNHPTEHKIAAYRYLNNRMILYLSHKKQNGKQSSQ